MTSRGPYGYAAEYQILREHAIDLLISKDSGGTHTGGQARCRRAI
jgi:precorrin-6A/cobalt-precorrin-6A reductase